VAQHFDDNVIIQDALGTPVAPGGYFGFASVGDVPSTGPRIYAGTGLPNGVLVAPRASLFLANDTGVIWINTDGATTWVQTGTLAGAVVLTGIDSTATANFDWDLAVGSATAFSFDDGGVSLFAIDTATDTVIVNAAGGLRLNDNSELRFGTPGTDVVFTPDGTDVLITGTGRFNIEDALVLGFGNDNDFAVSFIVAGAGTLTIQGVNPANDVNSSAVLIDTGNANAVAGSPLTGGVAITTGNSDVDVGAAGVGGASGTISAQTGSTDTQNAGGTGGNSGPVNLTTGNALSTLGTSGNSGSIAAQTGTSADGNTGNVNLTTGNAATGNSGAIIITSGTAGGARGVLDINVDEIQLTTQATRFTIADNAAAVGFVQGNSRYFDIGTDNGDERVEIGVPTAAAATVAPYVRTDGTDFGPRFVLVFDCNQRVQTGASIANTNASKELELIGTNATDAQCVFATGGGLSLVTAGAANDQTCVRGHLTGADNSQSPWTGTTWDPNDQLVFKAVIRVSDTADTAIAAGLKLTLAAGATLIDASTDADQVWFGAAADGAARWGGTVLNNVWGCISSIANVDGHVTAGVAFVAGQVRLVIAVAADRTTRFYFNGVLVHTTAAITGGVALLPFVAIVQTAGAVGRAMMLQRIGVSKLYTAA